MRKSIFILLSSTIFAFFANANLLHDSIKAGDLGTVKTLLEQGEFLDDYKPNAIDSETNETTYDALNKCIDFRAKEAIKELLDQYCNKYNVKIPSEVEAIYSTNTKKRKFPLGCRSLFINNNDIIEVYSPTERIERIGVSSKAIFVNNWVIKQKDSSSCGPASILMRQLDLRAPLSTVWFSINGKTVATELVNELKVSGIDAELITFSSGKIKHSSQNVAAYLAETIPLKGPAIVNGFNNNGGGHWFIVDEVQLNQANNGYAIIRDPFHGWQIKINQKAFLSIVGLNKNFKPIFDNGDDVSLGDIIWTQQS